MGALVIDEKKYARVLAKVLPRVIGSDEEHERMLAEIAELMDRGERRAIEEDTAPELMVRLIQDYESISRRPALDLVPAMAANCTARGFSITR
ncbi:MAG: hypothetical protein Q8N47_16665 [Bryobacterales bacterium]|nr:hypothetical protein [Bryobacterales bacterium]